MPATRDRIGRGLASVTGRSRRRQREVTRLQAALRHLHRLRPPELPQGGIEHRFQELTGGPELVGH